jgi:WD40 repeat protein
LEYEQRFIAGLPLNGRESVLISLLRRQTFCIDNAHGQLVRDLDFNPNKQYFIVTCTFGRAGSQYGAPVETRMHLSSLFIADAIVALIRHWLWSAAQCFNASRFFCIAGGDDNFVKFWDTRNSSRALMTLEHHTHWSAPLTAGGIHSVLLKPCRSIDDHGCRIYT